jgi:glycosyltransferase involved in cell wall biosynthesis
MRILVIRWGTLESFPPAINLSQSLCRLGHDVTVMANGAVSFKALGQEAKRVDLGEYPKPGGSGWLKARLAARSKLRSYIKLNINNYDLVWTTSDNSAIYCNDIIPPEKHILQLAELVEYVPVIGSASLFKSKRFVEAARLARRVVVPEVNRAFIQKAWWNLPETPAVLPNKPAIEALPELSDEEKPAYIEVLQSLKRQGIKVILYQGGFTRDRDIETYCKAVDLLGEGYAMCLMGPENDYSKELCSKYENTQYIGVYPPPLHLYAGKYALAGILPYRSNPERVAHLSPLNSLYCAPNKLWEYALVGLPMIANNLPGLQYTIESNRMGVTVQESDPENVVRGINNIESHYGLYSKNARKFYESIDFDGLVASIVDRG